VPLDPSLRELPVEDIDIRDPEWEVLERGDPTQPSEGRIVYWDPVHGWIKSEGPIVQIKPPLRPY
jgi:hypothetical protein